MQFNKGSESSISFENTNIWKYSKFYNESILSDRFKIVMKNVDANQYDFVYYATNLKSANLISKRLNAVSSRYLTDLGPGFYCGTNMESCINYALLKDGRSKAAKSKEN
eukprot:NODE_16_length_49026_cov_1.035992.p29 type:complete len:109 gc:universal NODE_16_length_49026_cov_1.035992:16083-16409(+)